MRHRRQTAESLVRIAQEYRAQVARMCNAKKTLPTAEYKARQRATALAVKLEDAVRRLVES